MEAERFLRFVERMLSQPSDSWRVLLEFYATDDEMEDWSQMSQALPWLAFLGTERNIVCTDLRRFGLALVRCDDEGEAQRAFNGIRGWRIAVRVFGPDGQVVPWQRPPQEKASFHVRRKRSTRKAAVARPVLGFPQEVHDEKDTVVIREVEHALQALPPGRGVLFRAGKS